MMTLALVTTRNPILIMTPPPPQSARRVELPILARAALAALATPAYSMDVERVSSPVGGLLSPQRMGLSAENEWSHLLFAVHGDLPLETALSALLRLA